MKIAYVNFCGSGGCGHGRGASRAAPVDVESGDGLAMMNEANWAAAVSMLSSCMECSREEADRKRERGMTLRSFGTSSADALVATCLDSANTGVRAR